jgi:hypothetical protein
MVSRLLHRCSQIAILCLCANSAHAASAESLFDSYDVLTVELRGPLTTTRRDTEERNERSFVLDIDGQRLDVAVRVRGNSRARVCNFPPLRLKFSPNDTSGTAFVGQDELKLVTHCKDTRSYEQNVLSEYAAYRILGMLSEVAFRVRLMRIRYVDTDKPDAAALIRYGFVVEPETELADRVGGAVLQLPHVVKGLLETEQAATVFVFQYLIGNTDWSLVNSIDEEFCCHNVKLLGIGELNYVVPYDFDLAGLVDARYAKPDPSIGTRSVRARRYRGYCVKGLPLEEVIAELVAQEGAIADVVGNLPGATDKDRRNRTKYLEKFFVEARDTDKLGKKFERRCIDK